MRRSNEVTLARIAMVTAIMSSAPTFAQNPPPQGAKSPAGVQYGDWTLKCQNGDQNTKLCELTQLVIEKEKRTPFAQIAIGRLKPEQPLQITLVAPVNVTFASGARVATDEKDPHPVDLGWTRCLPGACYASAQLKDDILRIWTTKTQPGRVLFLNGGGQVTIIPISFNGLAQAIDALGKLK